MVDKVCETLLDKIRKNDSTIDNEKAEIIYYGLQNLFGELPKIFLILCVAIALGVFKLVLIGMSVLLIYRGFAGGVHLKTHFSCFFVSTFLIVGSAYLAKYVVYKNAILIYFILFFIDFVLALLFAPADTENRPIMKETQRKRQKIESLITVTVVFLLSTFFIKNSVITNLFMYMITAESLMITPIAYKIFKNKTGEERRKKILENTEESM